MFSCTIKGSVAVTSVVTLILISSPAINAKSDRPSLGVISIGMTGAEVIKRLGKPLKGSRSQCGRELYVLKGRSGYREHLNHEGRIVNLARE